jgi:peptidoglycan/xylan/chitin deacetylase (PgdA/CDA1 family)
MGLRAAAKELVYGLAHSAGIAAVGRRRRSGTLAVLTYHSFGATAEHPYLHRLPLKRLVAQLAHLKRHYDVVTLEEGLLRLQASDAPPMGDRPMVAITVDDGYSDNREVLFPALCEAKLPATIFLATDYLDTGRLPWPTRVSALLHFATRPALTRPLALAISSRTDRLTAGRALRLYLSRLSHFQREETLAEIEAELAPYPYKPLRPLKWDEVREMLAAGISFGSHTQHHGWLDCLEPAEVERELRLSRLRIEAETDTPCPVIAYPNGNWNESVVLATEQAGYTFALSQEAGVNAAATMRPLALKRIEVPFDENIGVFACRVGGVTL